MDDDNAGLKDAGRNELFRLVKKLGDTQDAHKLELENKILSIGVLVDARYDKLQRLVVGDGDEEAIVIRLRDAERGIKEIRTTLDKLEIESRENRIFLEAWRNRAIGIMIAFPIITALLVIVLSRVLGLTLSP
jgi:hypothetical protein